MNKFKLFFVFFLLVSTECIAQLNPSYYLSVEGLKQANLKTALSRRIVKHTVLSYDSLWVYFRSTDSLPENRIWDMYSDNEYYFSDYSSLEKEHSFPKSWWGGSSYYASYSDLHHLNPSDKDANRAKSNYPLGVVDASPTFDNGVSKVGNSVTTGYTGIVFEPADEYKGDFARAYFYVVTCYQDLASNWVSPMLENNTYPVFTNWAINMLLNWSTNDPVSEREINRNNAVAKLQNCRNPFIDYPDLANYIWGDKQDVAFYTESEITDPIIFSPWASDTVFFDNVFESDSCSQTLYVRGGNLTGDLTVTISNDENGYFSTAGQTVITQANGQLDGAFPFIIKYKPTAVGEDQATLTISGGGATSVVVILKGNSLSKAVEKPVLANATNVGTNSATLSWAPIYKADNYYLDVYKKGEMTNAVVLSEDFSGFTATSYTSSAQGAHSSDISDSLDYFMQSKEWSGEKIYQANQIAKLGTSSAKGYLQTPALDLSFNNGNYVVSFDAKIWTYTTEATSILLLCNDVQQKEITLTTEMLNYSYDIANGLDSAVIKFSAKNATKNRYFLDNISIQQQQPKKIYFYENYNVGNAIVFDLENLESGVEYFCVVRGNKGGDISANSNIISFMTSPNSINEYTEDSFLVSVSKFGIEIQNKTEKNVPVKIFNTLGQEIKSTILDSGKNFISLPQGFYFIKIGEYRIEKISL